MKKLKLGIVTNKELAQWFGISASAFSKYKQDKLEELHAYADFELVGNKQFKVKIIKIYQDVYYKKGSESYETIKSKLNTTWSENGLDSCKRVCKQILEHTELSIAPATAYKYTIRSRNDLFGKPFQQGGPLGSCRYLWCKKNDDGTLRELSEEEEEIKARLIKKYFGDASEKQIIVQAMVEAGEISKNEAWDMLTSMTNMQGGNFLGFLKELQLAIGCKVIRGTMVERLPQSAF